MIKHQHFDVGRKLERADYKKKRQWCNILNAFGKYIHKSFIKSDTYGTFISIQIAAIKKCKKGFNFFNANLQICDFKYKVMKTIIFLLKTKMNYPLFTKHPANQQTCV